MSAVVKKGEMFRNNNKDHEKGEIFMNQNYKKYFTECCIQKLIISNRVTFHVQHSVILVRNK